MNDLMVSTVLHVQSLKVLTETETTIMLQTYPPDVLHQGDLSTFDQ